MDGYNDRIRQWVAAQEAAGFSEQQNNSDAPPIKLVSGIEGRSISTTMPGARPIGVEQVQPIVTPSQVSITVFDETGRKVSKIQPDAQGNFRVSLKPGTYRLKPDLPTASSGQVQLLGHEEQIVTVEAEQFQSVMFNYTTLAP